MTGNKKKGKMRQDGVRASSNSDPSIMKPGLAQQKQRKDTLAKAPIYLFDPGRAEPGAAQTGKGTTVLRCFTESKPPSKPRSALRDDTACGRQEPVDLNTGIRTGDSSMDGLGHSNSEYPPDPDLDIVPAKPKLLNRFYEPLVLLHVLDPSRGSRIPRYSSDVECQEEELRRSFIDSMAYICDYEKGGDTVTAAAIQKEPAGVTIWLAANTNVQDKTISYLRNVLDTLVAVNVSNRADTEELLARKIISFNNKRLQAYRTFTRQPLSKSLKALKKGHNNLESSADISETCAWLEALMKLVDTKDCDLHKLVHNCFRVRTMTPFRVLTHLAKNEQSTSPFRHLRHYIGRLGEHLKATGTLVSAALAMPSLLDGFSINVRRSSHSIPSPLAPERIDLHGIIGRAFRTEEDIARYRALISSMDRILDGDLLRGVKDKCSFSTRVHAELLLVDLFQEHGFDFVADDRYISCSKPACYCCFHYISALREGFSLSMPACHNNLYLPWRAPDIPKCRGAGPVKMRENALNTMIVSIRADLRRQIDSRAPRRPSQFDSLTGVTSLCKRDLPGLGDLESTFPGQIEQAHIDEEDAGLRSRSSSVDVRKGSSPDHSTEHSVDADQNLRQATTDSGLYDESFEDSDSGGVWLPDSL